MYLLLFIHWLQSTVIHTPQGKKAPYGAFIFSFRIIMQNFYYFMYFLLIAVSFIFFWTNPISTFIYAITYSGIKYLGNNPVSILLIFVKITLFFFKFNLVIFALVFIGLVASPSPSSALHIFSFIFFLSLYVLSWAYSFHYKRKNPHYFK